MRGVLNTLMTLVGTGPSIIQALVLNATDSGNSPAFEFVARR